MQILYKWEEIVVTKVSNQFRNWPLNAVYAKRVWRKETTTVKLKLLPVRGVDYNVLADAGRI